MNKQSTAIAVANEALDHLEVANDCLAWLESLAYAIQITIKSGHGFHAEHLAGAARYLSADCRNALNCEVERLNENLEAPELRG